jgi:hypothetical protein
MTRLKPMTWLAATAAVLAQALLLGACVESTSNADSSSAVDATTRHCRSGQTLEPSVAASLHEKWETVTAARSAPAVQSEQSLDEACLLANGFVNGCPAWDPDVAQARKDVCESFQRARVARSTGTSSSSDTSRPTGAASAGPARREPGDRSCVAGTKLAGIERRDREQKWEWIQSVRRTKRSDGHVTLASACSFARAFVATCRAWDPDVAAAASEVCGIADRDCAPDITDDVKPALAREGEPQLQALLRADPALESLPDPTTARKSIAEARSKLVQLNCFDATAGAKWAQPVAAWADALEIAIVEEQKCRATPACMLERKHQEICVFMAERQETLNEIATTKAYARRVGVVSLSDLHDLSEKLRYTEAKIAEAKREYATQSKAPFSAKRCR